MSNISIIKFGRTIDIPWDTQKKMEKICPREPQYTGVINPDGDLIHEKRTIIWLPNSARYPDVFLRPSQFGPEQFQELCAVVAGYSDEDIEKLLQHFVRLERLFGGQFRKQTGEPAFWHPRAVAINHIVLGNRSVRQTMIDLNHDCIEDVQSLRNIVRFIMESRKRVDGVFEDEEILTFFDNDPVIAEAVFALSERGKILEKKEDQKSKEEYYRGLLGLFPEIAELIMRSKAMDRLHYLLSSAWEDMSEKQDHERKEKKIQETTRYLLKEILQVDRKLGEILKNAVLLHISERQFHRIKSH